jgi:4-hydroxy 2-oxovalerate aldolase
MKLIDCTLRDGGYYNAWNFDAQLISDYLQAMSALDVDYVELGFRTLKNKGFNGGCAFTTEDYINSLNIPNKLKLGVMVNASELVLSEEKQSLVLQQLFPVPAIKSKIKLVRIACHIHEFLSVLPASTWLKEQGYIVGFNLMQVADRSQEEIEAISQEANKWPLDVLYFADSMGNMNLDDTSKIIRWFRSHWHGPMGIHCHDNMGMALQNTLKAMDEGVNWIDATVTGMGRGPGNTKTEFLVLELEERGHINPNITPLMSIIRKYFQPMKHHYGWGANTFYYLSGKYGIHPTYIQEMLDDSRYNEEDILAVIEHLRVEGGKKYNAHTLDAARHFFKGNPRGNWHPANEMEDREVLILGSGPGVAEHRKVLERYIRKAGPYVIALNTQATLSAELIDVRIACHPVRLLADCEEHTRLPQPLITPASMLPEDVLESLKGKKLLDYGIGVQNDTFVCAEEYCILPNSLVIAYALAVATSGRCNRILLAGFDGYSADDPRYVEMQALINSYLAMGEHVDLCSVTPTRYNLPIQSVYAL